MMTNADESWRIVLKSNAISLGTYKNFDLVLTVLPLQRVTALRKFIPSLIVVVV